MSMYQDRGLRTRSRARIQAIFAAVGLSLTIVALSGPATAEAAPDITLDKQAPAAVLFGDDSVVHLRATNPGGQPYGYNLSFRDVLPAGISYVPGSAPIAPQIIANQPTPGATTLIFENVSDLSPGSTYDLGYSVAHDTAVFAIGDDYTNQAAAYVNDDPRFVPRFGANGVLTGGSTGSATDSATTNISAIEIVKDEPSPEGELLRGSHDHQTVYTLTVRNNSVNPTDSIDVEDWLPAGLEYLGCGDVDNTTDAATNRGSDEEYPGSGSLDGNIASPSDCATPDVVETVSVDPDGSGPLSTGVYTHVVWNDLGSVAANGQMTIKYVAAVPLRTNTMTWTGLFPPTPGSLLQTANLDNNSGPETHDEQALTNYARVTGSYDGSLPVTDDHTLTRSAEDLAVQKRVSSATIAQGQTSVWSLDIRTSEYRYSQNVVVQDALPDGLCPLGAVNYEGGGQQEAECNPVAGQNPSAAYQSVTENSDGGYDIAWDQSTVPELALRPPSSTLTIDFPTRTRSTYQENFQDAGPILARDSWENSVDITGLTSRICTPNDPVCSGGGTKIDGDAPEQIQAIDTSAARQAAGGVSIDKTVRESAPAPVNCATGNYIDGPPPNYGPGDRICWQLRIDFATSLDSGQPELADFLPPGTTYVPGSAVATPNNNVTSTFSAAEAANGLLTWDLGTDVDPGGLIFEWRFATVLGQTETDSLGDIDGNLMKLSYANTGGETFPLRDQVDFARSQASLDLVKGVRRINGAPAAGNAANVDGGLVVAADDVEYRVDVSNDGDLDAANAVVWDELRDGVTCADVGTISNGGACSGTRITWTGIAVAAGDSEMLTYVVEMPTGIEPGKRFDNDAGVVSYQSATNTGGAFTYVPADNIDPGAPAANAPAADDDSFVTTRDLTLTKTRVTGVNETGNNLASEATIGERVDYTVTLVVPEGTTLYGSPVLGDVAGSRHTYVSSTATLNGGVLPGGFTTADNPVSTAAQINFPASYQNAPGSGDDTFVLTLNTTVADVAANRRTTPNQTLSNTANFAWEYQDGADQSKQAGTTTTIVEPTVAVAKNEDDADDIVSPGQTINYTVTATNPSGTRVSTAHNLQLIDTIPAGLTPGTISNGGVWDSGARTITWTIASLAPGANAVRTYSATVEDPAVVGDVFNNQVALTATSLAGVVTGERTATSNPNAGYVAQATDTVRLAGASLTKSVAPGEATIGDQVTYTAVVTFPANITYYDATVIDALPDGLVYDNTVSVDCGGACSPAVTTLPAAPQPDGTTRLGWYLGDLPNQPQVRTYTITYRAHVADDYISPVAPVVRGNTLTNSATGFYNSSDLITTTPTTVPSSGGFDEDTGPDTADVDVVEPIVTIDKGVSGDTNNDDVRDTQPGESYTYSLVVRNTGDAPAYDIDVTDTLDETLLRNITPVANPAATVTDGVGTDGTLGWTIPGPIAPNSSVTITYTADLAPSAELNDGDQVVNVADVPSYWAAPPSERSANPTWDFREYTIVPNDTVMLNVRLPDLTVTKTTGAAGFPNSSGAQVGEPFTWRVVVRNDSPYATAESVDLSDVLPANWDYVAGSASFAPGGASEPGIAADPDGDTLTWSNIADLDPAEQVVLTFQARPTAAAMTDPGSGTGSPHVNSATATAVDAAGATGSADGPYADDDDAQAILELPELEVTKTPDGDTIAAGSRPSYSIVIANNGDVPARDVVVTDVIGAGQTYGAGDASASPSTGFAETSVAAGPGPGETTIGWTIASIAANSSVTITVPVDTDPGLPDASPLVNDASVVSREILTPETDDGSLVTEIDSDIGIVKQAQAAAVEAGEEMDFTMTVTNHGPSDATGVTVEDVLPANLTFVSADTGCANASGTVTCAIGALSAGQSVNLTLRVRVDANETVSVSNTATVDSTTPDSDSTNNTSTATKPVGVEANVAVEKTAPTSPILQGTTFDYTIQVSNTGVSAATAVTLSDPLPAGVTYDSVVTDTGTCQHTAGTINCALGTLAPGQSVEITVTVLAVAVGTPDNTATAATPSTESTTTDNDDNAQVTIVPAADLGVTKSAPATAVAGSQIEYLLQVTNNGPSAATGVELVDTLPAGVQFVSADDPACTEVSGVVTCAVGAMAVSASRDYRITVEVPYALGGQLLTNSVVVTGNEGDLVPTNDSDQANTTVGPAADVSVVKTSNGATAGATASWTLVVRNDGPSTANPVTLVDQLPAGTTFRSATPGQGSCNGSGTDLTCDLGAIAAGGSTQIAVIADVPAGAVGQQLLNTATVDAPQPDPQPANNVDDVATIVTPPALRGPNLAISKTASTQSPKLGKPFSYELVVTNIGDADAPDVRVVDTMSKAVDVQKVTTDRGRCSKSSDGATCSLGTLKPGQRALIRLVVVPKRAGELRNVASANVRGNPRTGTTTDPDPSNNDDTANVRVSAPRAGWTLGKRASSGAVRGGELVRFRMTVRTGRAAIANAEICDRLPSGLVFVRAPRASLRNGRACWTVPYIPARAQRTFTVTARAERGFNVRRIRNVAVATAGNGVRRAAAASVRIDPAFGGAGGGVTG
ncbi:MAG TPA: isopeptide-forming domain-containing fimbrial protein [Baekduia sp.]|nr:isopeptide-forming domain-containing fimbrial protein [Baekduia sp.]